MWKSAAFSLYWISQIKVHLIRCIDHLLSHIDEEIEPDHQLECYRNRNWIEDTEIQPTKMPQNNRPKCVMQLKWTHLNHRTYYITGNAKNHTIIPELCENLTKILKCLRTYTAYPFGQVMNSTFNKTVTCTTPSDWPWIQLIKRFMIGMDLSKSIPFKKIETY